MSGILHWQRHTLRCKCGDCIPSPTGVRDIHGLEAAASRYMWKLVPPERQLSPDFFILSIPQEWIPIAHGLTTRPVSVHAVWLGGRRFACSYLAPG